MRYNEKELLKDVVAGSGKLGTWQRVEVRRACVSVCVVWSIDIE